MVNNWLNIIQDYAFSPTCILCGKPGFDSQDICQPCMIELKRNTECCYQCAERFESSHKIPQLCGQCIRTSPAFDETHAPYCYQGPMRYLISSLKFNRQFKNARLLGYLLAQQLAQTVELPELIIPVPLHKTRFRERGFNQSIEIAKNLSRLINIPIDTKHLSRTRDTPHQIDLPARMRQKNIKNAFQINKSLSAKHVAILDDVMTTGSTVNEIATILKKHGIEKVDIWVCARA